MITQTKSVRGLNSLCLLCNVLSQTDHRGLIGQSPNFYAFNAFLLLQSFIYDR